MTGEERARRLQRLEFMDSLVSAVFQPSLRFLSTHPVEMLVFGGESPFDHDMSACEFCVARSGGGLRRDEKPVL